MTELAALRAACTKHEARRMEALATPAAIQTFLDSIEYSEEERYRCPLTVLRERKGHCFDGALFAAAMLRRIGHPPLIVDIIPNDNDDDHLLAIYSVRGHWGAVAKSNYSGLRYREPVYRTLRELVMSYFDDFFNALGEKTMRAYTRPLNLKTFDSLHWMTIDDNLDAIGVRLDAIRKNRVLTPAMIRSLTVADRRSVQAGLLGSKPEGLFKAKPPRSHSC